MKELLFMRLPLASEVMTTVRLATGGVCSLAGLSLDESEDCKVCVTESLLLLLHAGYGAASLSFCEDGGRLFIALEGIGTANGGGMPEDEISAALLGALAEDVVTEKRAGVLGRISFRF